MLRSLDPTTDYSSPKSKKFRPSKSEEKKFSPGELEAVQSAASHDEDLQIRRFAVTKQRQEALSEMKGARK